MQRANADKNNDDNNLIRGTENKSFMKPYNVTEERGYQIDNASPRHILEYFAPNEDSDYYNKTMHKGTHQSY